MREALATLPWVRQVEVDFDQQQATVTVVAAQYDEKSLLRVLEKEGYRAKVVKPRQP